MNKELQTIGSKAMTTKELAKQLNTSRKVILENAKKCLPQKIIENGKPTYWNEQETTALLYYMQNNKQTLFNSQAKQPFTDGLRCMSTNLTPALKIKQALLLMQEGYEEELARIANENKRLKVELDKAKEYITIKRMEKLNPEMHFNWRLLKTESQRLNKPAQDTFDQNYGTVKAYHIDVWEAVYYDSINYPE